MLDFAGTAPESAGAVPESAGAVPEFAGAVPDRAGALPTLPELCLSFRGLVANLGGAVPCSGGTVLRLPAAEFAPQRKATLRRVVFRYALTATGATHHGPVSGLLNCIRIVEPALEGSAC